MSFSMTARFKEASKASKDEGKGENGPKTGKVLSPAKQKPQSVKQAAGMPSGRFKTEPSSTPTSSSTASATKAKSTAKELSSRSQGAKSLTTAPNDNKVSEQTAAMRALSLGLPVHQGGNSSARKTATRTGDAAASQDFHASALGSVAAKVPHAAAQVETAQHPGRESLDCELRPPMSESPILQFPSDTDRMLKKSALIDSLQELEWITEDAKKQAAAALQLAAQQDEQIRLRKKELRELEMLLAEAEQGMVAATSPTQTAAPVVAGVGAKTGESGAETGKQAPGVGTGLAKKVDKTLGVDIDGSELLGVTELQFAALEVQVLANQGDLLLAGQLIKNEGDEGKADDEAQKLIGETVKEIGVAQRKLQKGSDRLSIDAGGMVSGAGAEAGEKESEEKAGYQVSSDEITTSAADTRVEDLQSELARTREAAAKDAKKAARMTKVVAELQKKVQNLTAEKNDLTAEVMAVKQVFDEQVARVHEAGEARVQDVMRLMDEQLELQRRDLQGMHNRLQRALEDNVRLGQELREAFYSATINPRGRNWEAGGSSH